jgi:rod shape-determining protein MreD
VKALPAAAAVFVAAMLQAGLAPHMSINGVAPNLLLLVVITLALAEGPSAGAAAGFASGLVFDLIGTGPVGPMVLVMVLVGFGAGLLHSQMFAEGWLLPLTVLGIAALGAEIAYGVLLSTLGEGGPFFAGFVDKMLPGAVYDTVLALLVYPWLARFLRRDQPMKTFRRLA